MLIFDSETCGFHGPAVLYQYAHDDGEVQLHSVFKSPIYETLELLESFCKEDVVGFNLAFDWFHVNKSYNTLLLLGKEVGMGEYPEDHINEMAEFEDRALSQRAH
jgi:hypothetical protein